MKLIIILALIFQLSGCSVGELAGEKIPVVSPTPTVTPKSQVDQMFEKKWKEEYEAASVKLDTNRKLWRESNIVNYDFVSEKPDPGGVTNTWQRAPVLIKVRNGDQISIEMLSKKDEYAEMYRRTDGFEDIDTIDKLFAYLRKELDGGRILSARYDKKFGYPKDASLEFTFATHAILSIKISKFEIIK